MKPRKPGTLNAADKATITNIIRSECLPLNREHRKRLRQLEKENAKLRKATHEMALTIAEKHIEILTLRDEIERMKSDINVGESINNWALIIPLY